MLRRNFSISTRKSKLQKIAQQAQQNRLNKNSSMFQQNIASYQAFKKQHNMNILKAAAAHLEKQQKIMINQSS